MQTELRLRKAVDALLDSYHSHPEIQSIGCSGLPARESIVQLANDLQVLLFPGLLRQEQLDAISLPYWLGQKSASIFYRLRDYLEQVICWQSRQEGLPQPPAGACSERAEEISLNLLETLPEMREVLAEDVEATFAGDPAANDRKEIVLAYPGIHALSIYRIAHFLHNYQIPLMPRILSEHVHSLTGIDINPGARIGRGVMIDHGTGIVIGGTAVIHDQVRIYQGVTLGAFSPIQHKNEPHLKRHPTIERETIIYAGATILGGNTVVGARSIIGGNVWLTHSVPPDSRVYIQEPGQQRTEVRAELEMRPTGT
ncbi:MAG: serine acetyltransferase [bacterium]|jgi:serine O-acetyltransferase